MKRVRLFALLLPAVLFLFVLVPSVAAESKTFNAVKDTYANKAYPDKVNGSQSVIILSNKYTDRLGFIQFEDVNLPEGATLIQANLKFYVYEVHYATTAKLNVGPVTEDWEESSLTWNNKPAINQTMAIEATIEMTEGWKTVSLTNLVSQWLNDSLGNKGVFIYPYGFLYATPETEFALSMRSREYSENPPRLEVEYSLAPTATPTPKPTAEPSPEIIAAEEATPAETTPEPEEESPTPTPEGAFVLNLTRGQTIIGGLILFALVATVVAFAVYSQQKPKEKPKKKKKEVEPEEKEEE